MNLDKLISKYLDSELTRAEDKELRQRLSEDAIAKQAFDAHVFIHAAFKEDANTIEPSADLVSRTEDMILTKILAEQPIVGDTLPERKSYKIFTYSALIVILLLMAVISISEMSIGTNKYEIASALNKDRANIVRSNENILFDNNYYQPETIAMNLPKENSNGKNQKFVASVSHIKKEKIVSNNIISSAGSGSDTKSDNLSLIMNSSSKSIENVSNTRIREQDVDISGITTQLPETNFINNKFENSKNLSIESSNTTPVFLMHNGIDLENSKSSFKNSYIPEVRNSFSESNENYFYGKRSEVQLTSFLGTNVMQSGFASNTPKVVANFSQSIAYKINTSQHFGLDFGYANYSYDKTGTVTLPVMADNSHLNNRQSEVEIRETGPSSNYIDFPVTINIHHQMFWGAAFFDQCLFGTNKFKLNGRIALGGTNEGPLAYLRLYAKYRLFRWFSINAGVDGRMLKWEEPAFGVGSNSYKSSLSIIYGFEINI